MRVRYYHPAEAWEHQHLDWEMEVRDERDAKRRLEQLKTVLKHQFHGIDMQIIRKRGQRREGIPGQLDFPARE